MAKEIETKFKIDSPLLLKKRLKKLGAKFISKKFEKDTYYFFPGDRRSSNTARLRSFGKKGIFTVKGPTIKDKSRKLKIREEFQTKVSDVKVFAAMLDRIGFVPGLKKEKIRETYKLKKAFIVIDKLPFMGFYVEIEASKNEIKKIAKLLEFSMKKAIPNTYMELFKRYKTHHKKPNLKLLFKDNS